MKKAEIDKELDDVKASLQQKLSEFIHKGENTLLGNLGEKLGTSLLDEEEVEKPIGFTSVLSLLQAVLYPQV